MEGHRGVIILAAEGTWSAREVGGGEVTVVFNIALRQKSRWQVAELTRAVCSLFAAR